MAWNAEDLEPIKKFRRIDSKKTWENLLQPNLENISAMRRQGMSVTYICTVLGISLNTMEKYAHRYPELEKVLVEDRRSLRWGLETSLYKMAHGYEYEETEITISKDGKQSLKRMKRHHPANVGAICFALKNVAPADWKDERSYRLHASTDDDMSQEEKIGFIQRVMNKFNIEGAIDVTPEEGSDKGALQIGGPKEVLQCEQEET